MEFGRDSTKSLQDKACVVINAHKLPKLTLSRNPLFSTRYSPIAFILKAGQN